MKDGARLADVGHLSWSVSVLHVLEERRLVRKRQLADLTRAWRERWFHRASTAVGEHKRNVCESHNKRHNRNSSAHVSADVGHVHHHSQSELRCSEAQTCWWLCWLVNSLHVAPQLERRHAVTETLGTHGTLPWQRHVGHVLLHVAHQPESKCRGRFREASAHLGCSSLLHVCDRPVPAAVARARLT